MQMGFARGAVESALARIEATVLALNATVAALETRLNDVEAENTCLRARMEAGACVLTPRNGSVATSLELRGQ